MKKLLFSVILLSLSFFANAQSIEQKTQTVDSTKTEILDEVLVKAVRVGIDSPITHTDVSKEDLKARNLGQDVPTLLNYLPSVVTTSDAGTGIGYSGIRVRGISGESTNITINGIPYNDAESLGTFWVNLPDFSSSVESLQLQRGVGTSTNGSGAFGASINVLTDAVTKEAYTSISNTFGSFNTIKHNVKFSTGLLNNNFEFSGRLSKIKSDGFIDRASSDLKSYFLQGTYKDENRLIKAVVFGGHEVTYQAWYGVDVFTIDKNRTKNIAGTITDNSGNVTGYYDNQVDDYKQDHFQLHWDERFNNNLSLNVSLNYSDGRGFYEEYIDNRFYTDTFFADDSKFSYLGLTPITVNGNVVDSMDYIRRKWLDNDFYVANVNLNYKNETVDVIAGGSFSSYEGDHFGRIIWAEYATEATNNYQYYFGQARKRDANSFIKATAKFGKVKVFGDIQGRYVDYNTTGVNSKVKSFILNKKYNFVNPKVGISINFNKENNLYASYARANREPSRNDFENNINVKPEQLNDFELGFRHDNKNIRFNANAYFMYYNDQLVLTGAVDNVGAPVRANAGKSYRAGLELETVIRANDKVSLQTNLTVSSNKNLNDDQFLNGTAIGETDIAYSPNVTSGASINYEPIKNLKLTLLSKYVSEQLMNNIGDEKSVIEAYGVFDFNIAYEIKPKAIFKSILINGVINNLANEEYITNGFDYGGGYYVYFPQAKRNFLVGATLTF